MKKNNTFSAGKREFMRRMRAGALEDEEQMKIFQLSNPKKAFLEYISALYNEETDSEHENSDDNYEEFDMMNPLCDKVLHKILKQSYAPQVILAYIKKLPFPCAEEDLCDYLILSNADKIMLEYIKKLIETSESCSEDIELKMFDYPNAPEIVLEYIKKFKLSGESQYKVFGLKNADQIMLELVKRHGSNVLSAEARNLIQDLPNAKEIMAAM